MGLSGQVVAERAGMSGARAAVGPADGAVTDVGVVPAAGAVGLLKRTVRSGMTTTAEGSSVAGAGIAAPGAGVVAPGAGGGVVEDVVVALEDGAAALEAARSVALPAGRVFDVQEAADFAARVEDLSRSIGYLQIIAAHAVERTRTEAKNTPTRTAPGWQTGWTENHPRQPRTNTDPAAAAAPSGTDNNPAAGVLAGTGTGVRVGVGADAPAGPGTRPPPASLPVRGRCWMTGTATLPSSCAPGSGSTSAKPAAD